MDSDKIYKAILIALICFIVYQIFRVWNTNYEHLNPALLTHQWANNARIPSNNPQLDFYIKNDERYNVENKYDPVLVDPLVSDPGLPCAGKRNWKTYQVPGANNTYSDLLWHQTSPRMVLQDNCLHCNKFDNLHLNSPDGVASELTSSQTNSLYTVQGALSDQNLMDSNASLEAPTEYSRIMATLGSGLPPMNSYGKL